MRLDVALRRAAAACVLVVAGSSWLAARQLPEQSSLTFRTGTELIQVDVSVLDRQRRPVRGLTAADFAIYEDGRLVSVDTFTEVELPARTDSVEAPWTRIVASDVVDNQEIASEGRVVVILLDRSIAPGWPWASAKRIATETIDSLGPRDLAAVLTGNGGSQNLTSNRDLLLRAVAHADPSGVSSPDADALQDGLHQFGGRAAFSPLADGRCMCGACGLESIARVADAVSGIPSRRKLLFFIGSHLVFQEAPNDNATQGCGFQLRDVRKAMFDALERSNLTVHSLDPTGLETWGAVRSTGDTMGRLQRIDSLKVLPDYTGGRSIGGNDPQDMVHRLFEESESYYLLGFRPAADAVPGRSRSIEVKVDRRGVRVHARRKYRSPAAADSDSDRDRSEAPLNDVVRSLLPATRVAMDLHIASFALPGSRRAMVAVSAGVGGFAPERESGDVVTPFELVASAYDSTGQPYASARQTLELSWPEAADDDAPRYVDALSRLDVEPGSYEIRVAAAGGEADRPASVYAYVTVPDYATTPFSLSHVVLGAGPATDVVPPGFFQGVLPIAPTTQRAFQPAGGVTAFMQVYQGTARTDALEPVGVRARIVDTQGTTVRDQALVLGPEEFAVGRTASVRLELPVQNLRAGEYLFRLEAMMGERVAGRALRFRVE